MLARVHAERDAGRFAKLRFLATTRWWLDIAQERMAEQVGGLGVHLRDCRGDLSDFASSFVGQVGRSYGKALTGSAITQRVARRPWRMRRACWR